TGWWIRIGLNHRPSGTIAGIRNIAPETERPNVRMNGIALAMSGARAPTRAKNSASPEEKTVRSTAANGSSSHDQVGTTAPMPGSSPVTIVTTIIATRIGANMTVSVITVDSGTTGRGTLCERISGRVAGIAFGPDMTGVWNSEYVKVRVTMNAARLSMPGALGWRRKPKMITYTPASRIGRGPAQA